MGERPILTVTPVGIEGGGVTYEWKVSERDVEGGGPDLVLGEGRTPTLLEAARDAGNATYDAWSYAESMGRLAIVGEKRHVVSEPYTFE